MVLDCGGGTIDWAYLTRQGGEFRVVPECPPGGDRQVGGHDVDLEILNLIAESLPPEAEADLAERQPAFPGAGAGRQGAGRRGLPISPIRVGRHEVRLPRRRCARQ